jgi:integrase
MVRKPEEVLEHAHDPARPARGQVSSIPSSEAFRDRHEAGREIEHAMSTPEPGEVEIERLGTRRKTSRGYFVQFSIGRGRRRGTTLRTCTTEQEAVRRQRGIARLVERLRTSGHEGMIRKVIREGGRTNTEDFAKLGKLVDRVASGKEPGLAREHGIRRLGLTVEELADQWTSGELARLYPDHVKVKKNPNDDASMLRWLGKVRLPDGTTFGERALASVTIDDCDHVMTALPKTAVSSSARRQYAQAVRRLLQLALYPLRLIPSHPLPRGWLPRVGKPRAKAWLYPSEDYDLMRFSEVPLIRRLFFGFLSREGLRVSEALRLTWADVDLERGVLRLDENKTDDARTWALGEDVTRALALWRQVRGKRAETSSRIFPAALIGKRWPLAQMLRDDLLAAGVARVELFEEMPGRKILRAHDLRGTFVTLALAAGQTEAWVTDRTGHRSSEMIYRYKRACRTAAELGLGWFAPLDEAIPELAKRANVTRQDANEVQTTVSSGPEVSPEMAKTPEKTSHRDRRGSGRWRSKSGVPQGTRGSNPLLSAELVVGSGPSPER